MSAATVPTTDLSPIANGTPARIGKVLVVIPDGIDSAPLERGSWALHGLESFYPDD